MSDVFAYFILAVGVVGCLLHPSSSCAATIPAVRRIRLAWFFDEHGHWPDQTPEEAEAERRELARAYTLSQPDEDGTV